MTPEYLTLLRALLSLSITLALLVLLAWAYKRWGSGFKLPAASTARLNILETRRLGTQTTLHLIRLDDTEQLIATTPTTTTVLHTQPVTKKKSS